MLEPTSQNISHDGSLPTDSIPRDEIDEEARRVVAMVMEGTSTGSSMSTSTPLANPQCAPSLDSPILVPSSCDHTQLDAAQFQLQFNLLPELASPGPLAATLDHGDGELDCEVGMMCAEDDDVEQFVKMILAARVEGGDDVNPAALLFESNEAGLPSATELHYCTPEPLTSQPLTSQPQAPQPPAPQPLTPQPSTPQPLISQPLTSQPPTPPPLTPKPFTPQPRTQYLTPRPTTIALQPLISAGDAPEVWSRHQAANGVGDQEAHPIVASEVNALDSAHTSPPHTSSPDNSSSHSDPQASPLAAVTSAHDSGAALETSSQEAGEAAEPGSDQPSSCTKYRLTRNRKYSEPGRYRGVRKRGDQRYSAELKVGSVRRWLGTYKTAEEAARAFDEAALEVSGLEAKLNFPLPEMLEMKKGRKKRIRTKGGTGTHAAEMDPEVQAAIRDPVPEPHAETTSNSLSTTAISSPQPSPVPRGHPVVITGGSSVNVKAVPISNAASSGASPEAPHTPPVMGPRTGAPALLRLPLSPRLLTLPASSTLRPRSKENFPAMSVQSVAVAVSSPPLQQCSSPAAVPAHLPSPTSTCSTLPHAELMSPPIGEVSPSAAQHGPSPPPSPQGSASALCHSDVPRLVLPAFAAAPASAVIRPASTPPSPSGAMYATGLSNHSSVLPEVVDCVIASVDKPRKRAAEVKDAGCIRPIRPVKKRSVRSLLMSIDTRELMSPS